MTHRHIISHHLLSPTHPAAEERFVLPMVQPFNPCRFPGMNIDLNQETVLPEEVFFGTAKKKS